VNARVHTLRPALIGERGVGYTLSTARVRRAYERAGSRRAGTRQCFLLLASPLMS
jgi:hypothetical protein